MTLISSLLSCVYFRSSVLLTTASIVKMTLEDEQEQNKKTNFNMIAREITYVLHEMDDAVAVFPGTTRVTVKTHWLYLLAAVLV